MGAAERKEFGVSEPFDSGRSINAKQEAQESKMPITAGDADAAGTGTRCVSPLSIPGWSLRRQEACGWCKQTKNKSPGRIKTIEPAELQVPPEKWECCFLEGSQGEGRQNIW